MPADSITTKQLGVDSVEVLFHPGHNQATARFAVMFAREIGGSHDAEERRTILFRAKAAAENFLLHVEAELNGLVS